MWIDFHHGRGWEQAFPEEEEIGKIEDQNTVLVFSAARSLFHDFRYCRGARCNPLFAFGRGRLFGVTYKVKGSSAQFAQAKGNVCTSTISEHAGSVCLSQPRSPSANPRIPQTPLSDRAFTVGMYIPPLPRPSPSPRLARSAAPAFLFSLVERS